MPYTCDLGGQRHSFADLKAVLAAASPLRSGDELAGLAASSATQRVAARWVLDDLPLKTFLTEAVVAYESDEVTRLIVDGHDPAAFAPIAHRTVGSFRDWLLSKAADEAALAFAIWFFLAIEGVAMAAEEAKEPRRTIPRAYISGILTLTVLAFGVMLFAGGSGSWAELSSLNAPLPQAMKRAVGASSGWLHMLVWLGLFGLIASFHGIIMGYARQIFALGRADYLPAMFARLHPRFNTPHVATLAGGVVGIAAIYSDAFVSIAGQSLTASVVTLSAFGALLMYVVSMAALFRLRTTEPDLARPFRAPLYPVAPAFALAMASLALVTMAWNNRALAAIFAGLMVVLVTGALLLRRRDKA